ncbi:MAG: hypothetical protein JJ916_15100 [Phycisphaerales bacterium]|nr:hypothetical protein [Phycisphaerales bacterium]
MELDRAPDLEEALSECKRLTDGFRSLWRVLILSMLALLLVGGIYVTRSWVPFDQGTVSTNPTDYPIASKEIRNYFPDEARFLPMSIPSTATNIQFECNTMGAMQASPWLKIQFVLQGDQAAQELHRLESLNPTDTLKLGNFFSDPLDDLQDREGLLVYGFLASFKPDYRNGQAAAPDRIAYVTYDANSGEFYYEFNSD